MAAAEAGIRYRFASVSVSESVKRRSVEEACPPVAVRAAVLEDRSENAKLQNVEAGVEVVLAVESPADVAKSGYCRPPGHCRQTMSRFVLTSESDYCAGHYQTSFHNQDRPLACHRRRRRPLRPKVPEEEGKRYLPHPRASAHAWREDRASEVDCAVDKAAAACHQVVVQVACPRYPLPAYLRRRD